MYDVIIIGGGAAGMMAAITAAERKKRVVIIERMQRLGKKILATGNGRCNFTNTYLDDQCYRSTAKDFPYISLEQFGWEESVQFFEHLGIAVVEKEGYYYPRSNQATAIADGLADKIKSLHIPVLLEQTVTNVQRVKGVFQVMTQKEIIKGKNVIIAVGGKAQEKLGSNGSGYDFAKSFGHKVRPVFPALTALETKKHPWKEAAGVRCQSKVTAVVDGKEVGKEQGELQITKYGLSGVLIFQLSRYLINGCRCGKKSELVIDLLPEQKGKDAFYETMKAYSSYKTMQQFLEGYLPSKLASAVLKKAGILGDTKTLSLSGAQKDQLWRELRNAKVLVTGWKDFDFAQVTAGGVDVAKVSPYTMESELVPGLYFAGEVMDVDGTCGGYNLQWAWTSGYLAGRSVE